MSPRSSHRLWLSALCALYCALPSDVKAWTPYSERGSAWQSELSFHLSVPAGGRLNLDLHDALSRALALWSRTRCAVPPLRLLGTTAVAPNVTPDGADGLSVVGVERGAWPFGEGVTALTRIRERAGAIVEADILLNGVNFEWRAGAPARPLARLRAFDKTLPHELGHALGLGHSQDRDALMHEAVAHGRLAADDLLGLCQLYPARATTKEPHPVDRAIAPGLVILALLGGGVSLWYVRAKRRARQGATDSSR